MTDTLKIPKPKTMRHRVLLAIYTHGAMTAREIPHRIHDENLDGIQSALHVCRGNGLLDRNLHTYSLTAAVREYFDGCEQVEHKHVGEVATPRTVPEFSQLSAKYLPSLEARRTDAGPVHEVGYINGSAGVGDVFRGIGKP